MITPLSGVVELRGPRSAVYRIEPREQVIEGHYPGFPIFPGVCIVECVHRSALTVSPVDRPIRLAAVISTRFVTPAFPGDELAIDLDWIRDGDGWRCVAEVTTERGRAALVRLRFEEGTS
ncbi:hypothetical protein BBK82_30620 [Lentzea guizhouensis]|uniref:ApeI dehydratase-like domain-containing protein n=1 Tax=Lentzea guizhouensis TaxID=1586287 RepID=A0A1B2HPU6_9PSEU|nr:hypothetical protein [Lentzea guizhouensis]ANZ39749.1 hypothetical protein BBK82_30620 [Lentzea guizhouensis]